MLGGMTNETTRQHVWEIAGLGLAPYSYVGHSSDHYQACPGAPVQVGGSCDYCGQGIVEMYRFRSADGRTFKVGSECVKRAGDAGLVKMIAADVRAHNRAVLHERQDARIAAAVALLPSVRDALTSQRHPNEWRAAQGETLMGWVEWMLENAGRSGKCDAAKVIERAAKGAKEVA
jgi:hypothetical protein